MTFAVRGQAKQIGLNQMHMALGTMERDVNELLLLYLEMNE